MNIQKLRTYAEIVTLLLVSVAAVLFGVKTTRELLFQREHLTWTASQQCREGSAAPTIPGVDYGLKEKTVVFALSTGCRFCDENAPFYREAVAAGTRSEKLQIVFAFPKDGQDVATFLSRAGLTSFGAQSFTVARVDFGRIGVRATPTTLVVARDGTIRRSKVGFVSPSESGALVRELQQ